VAYTVFYSWQSDTDSDANRSFIRRALDGAIKKVNGTVAVEDAPRVDSGMEGVAGSPEVATVMFEKIRDSGVVVGDVSLVGAIARHDGSSKRTPNPNVLLELGYAAATLGWGRVIGVMNEHFGSAFEQPFDLRNRRFPIRYSLDPAKPSGRGAALCRLANDLAGALQAVVTSDHRAAETVAARLDTSCRAFIAQYAAATRIPEPAGNSFSLGSSSGLDTPRLLAAIGRLLDLGVIRAVYDSSAGYAYEWTYLGRAVVARLTKNGGRAPA
jgi:hypothetical protein